ncbi:unnamed protein product [Darwinula stevensoni]|uniref:Uncharacterized protein n=1 Tax=Darwinula stevensoni TaxID=69355 RepID=A0A7R9A2A2_9CRUS|nr:unnamed protein product [Darwinula stevensoni]CAG0879479.1 unnamed protein product [Darwinula stevensoni]
MSGSDRTMSSIIAIHPVQSDAAQLIVEIRDGRLSGSSNFALNSGKRPERLTTFSKQLAESMSDSMMAGNRPKTTTPFEVTIGRRRRACEESGAFRQDDHEEVTEETNMSVGTGHATRLRKVSSAPSHEGMAPILNDSFASVFTSESDDVLTMTEVTSACVEDIIVTEEGIMSRIEKLKAGAATDPPKGFRLLHGISLEVNSCPSEK